MINNEKINPKLKSIVLGTEDFNKHNKDSCLRGIPLSKLKDFLQLFSNNEIDVLHFLGNSKIAFRLHKLQIEPEIKSILMEKYPDEQERILLNPEEWKPNTFSRLELITKTKQLVGVLEDAIDKAKTSEI